MSDRSFFVRTFGCQMNEHDSERIAGLLGAEGMTEAMSEADADVIVLNTCCIRENADNKLYGTLGHLKTWKGGGGRPGIVSGLSPEDHELGAKRRVHQRVGAPVPQRAPRELVARRRSGPITEIFDEAVIDDHALFPSALPVRRESSFNAWVTIQIGCDNSCAFCIVPAVRGAEISRPFDDIVAEVATLAAAGVTEVTLLGQNVQLRARHPARCPS